MNATMPAISEMTVTAVVTRCGCSTPESHIDAVCPTPRVVANLGVIGHYTAPKE